MTTIDNRPGRPAVTDPPASEPIADACRRAALSRCEQIFALLDDLPHCCDCGSVIAEYAGQIQARALRGETVTVAEQRWLVNATIDLGNARLLERGNWDCTNH